jgi:uncharacterized Zn finger protein
MAPCESDEDVRGPVRYCYQCPADDKVDELGREMERIFGPGAGDERDWYLKCYRCDACGRVEPAVLRELRLRKYMGAMPETGGALPHGH